ncbi:TetR family transcriptional regulator [Streptomyces sp. SLBN-118]|uniref:TetR/AcrR family transcriptional regulator n=1 Tax=Streptomyces sp. SLBN-118 TaxID=2768454 RepID=UPI00114E083E|nr:TetR/AcrR family transcriptional regulator [Streptomyces sp. SLBN-118]TQK44238.1 TetR family transcriptional regulator [Streptomyces sp. SLBN-118]
MARLKTYDEALRLRLINRAAATVFDRGTAALSLRRLAADVKTSTTAVYSLFGNKAGLLDSLYREAARLFVARLATVDSSDDPANDVIRLGVAYREYALANPHLYAILFADRTVEYEPTDERKSEVGDTIQPLVDAVVRGQKAGQFAPDAPAEVIALSCWGSAHGLVSLELSGNEPPGLDIGDCYEATLRAVVLGWRPEPE